MELYEVMRTTFSAREFTDAPVPDEAIYTILDNARFASSGGNRQGWRVLIVRRQQTREALAALGEPAARRYAAQQLAGESPWNSVSPPGVDAATIENTQVPARLRESFIQAPVVLVVCVDLRVVASTDQYLERVGVISGASIYPFVWNILMAARHEGYGGTITTLAVAQEPRVKELLNIPAHVAVSAVIPMGRPAKRLTRLRRKPVSDFRAPRKLGRPAPRFRIVDGGVPAPPCNGRNPHVPYAPAFASRRVLIPSHWKASRRVLRSIAGLARRFSVPVSRYTHPRD